jgi:regulator of sirC expression with transglutaminase-like and TPR domain
LKQLNKIDVNRVKSLIYLLDDEDDSIYSTAKEHLLLTGEQALPVLEEYLQSDNSLMQQRIREVYEIISLGTSKEQLRAYCERHKGDLDLEEGAFLIAKHAYPSVDMHIYSDLLNFFAAEFQSRLDPSDSPEEIAMKIGSYFSTEKGFTGNEADYYNTDNHFLNKVIETKQGVPITLSVIYMLVLRRLNFPVQGIGMPGHFILQYDFGVKSLFVDPFHGGRILSLDDCKNSLQKLGYAFKNEYLEPVSNRQILERMMRNLVLVFEKKDEPFKMQSMLQCIDILNRNV